MNLFRSIKNRIFQILALYAPGSTSLRVWLHRQRGVTIGKDVFISTGAIIETEHPERISIGNNVTIGIRAVLIGHFFDQANNKITVRIEDDVYIGPGAIILPGVVIGKGAVISAGSVVKTSIPPKAMVVGNPAKIVAKCEKPLAHKKKLSYMEFLNNLKPIANKSNRNNTRADSDRGSL